MKKAILLIVCLCMMCSAAYAEETIELNWADIGSEEIQALGEFQQVVIPDLPAICFWIPSVMKSVDVSGMEGFFKPTALYATEDQTCSIVVFVSEISSLEEYAALMQSEGGGSDFRNVKINGVDCIAYEVKDSDLDCLVYPVSENVIISLNCTPLNGDGDWDSTKGAIFASIQPVQ